MAKTKLRLISVVIPPNGMHILVEVYINGMKARMVVDSGASQTVLDINRIEQFTDQKNFKKQQGHSSGIGSSSLESHVFKCHSIDLGNFTMRNRNVILMDMQHVNGSYALIGKKPVDGVLGGDLLKLFKATIDYQKRELILHKK